MKKAPRNPNKRDCVARNITFSVQKENEELMRLYSTKKIDKRKILKELN